MPVVFCGGASKSAKLPQGQQFFLVVYCLTRCQSHNFTSLIINQMT